MLPPLSYLFLLFGFPPGFPFGVFPLPLLALEKRLYLREQDTGQSFYLIVRYARTIVVGPLFPWHGIPSLELPFIEQVALENSAVPRDEAVPCVFGNLVGGAGVVQDDLQKHIIRPAADPNIQVVLDEHLFENIRKKLLLLGTPSYTSRSGYIRGGLRFEPDPPAFYRYGHRPRNGCICSRLPGT